MSSVAASNNLNILYFGKRHSGINNKTFLPFSESSDWLLGAANTLDKDYNSWFCKTLTKNSQCVLETRISCSAATVVLKTFPLLSFSVYPLFSFPPAYFQNVLQISFKHLEAHISDFMHIRFMAPACCCLSDWHRVQTLKPMCANDLNKCFQFPSVNTELVTVGTFIHRSVTFVYPSIPDEIEMKLNLKQPCPQVDIRLG